MNDDTVAVPRDVIATVVAERYWASRALEGIGDFVVSPAHEQWLTKAALGARFSMSKSWVEKRMAEGLPCKEMGDREKRFRVSECEPWLIANGHITDRRGGGDA